MSSSFFVEWYQEDKKRYRHQWWHPIREGRKRGKNLGVNRRGRLASMNRTCRSRDHGRQWYQRPMGRNLGRLDWRTVKEKCLHQLGRFGIEYVLLCLLTTGNTIWSESLLVNIEETIELTFTSTLLCGLVVVGETGTGVIKRVDEEEWWSTCGTTGCQVSEEPETVSITVLLVAEEGSVWRRRKKCCQSSTFFKNFCIEGIRMHSLEVIFEGKVQSLGREVPDDVGSVSSPDCVQATKTWKSESVRRRWKNDMSSRL